MSDVSISGDALALTSTFVDAIEPVIAQQSKRVRRSVAETYPYLRVTSSDSPLKEQVPDAMRAVASAAYVEGYNARNANILSLREACAAVVAASDTAPPLEFIAHISAAVEKCRAALASQEVSNG